MRRAGGDRLLEFLARSRERGFLGPGDPRAHLTHALGFVATVEAVLGRPPASFADLGTGGGVPGVVLAAAWPAALGVFVEANARRAAALRDYLAELGAPTQVQVLEGRGEVWAHDATHRERYEAVTARSFGAPAPTAEIGAGFVVIGGVLVVSEPPATPDERWATAALRTLGLGPPIRHERSEGSFAALAKIASSPGDRPRDIGRPTKRPLW